MKICFKNPILLLFFPPFVLFCTIVFENYFHFLIFQCAFCWKYVIFTVHNLVTILWKLFSLWVERVFTRAWFLDKPLAKCELSSLKKESPKLSVRFEALLWKENPEPQISVRGPLVKREPQTSNLGLRTPYQTKSKNKGKILHSCSWFLIFMQLSFL